MIDADIRDEVRRRAARAASEKEVGDIVMDALLSNDIDVGRASRDGIKQLIVDGVFAFRQSHSNGEVLIAG